MPALEAASIASLRLWERGPARLIVMTAALMLLDALCLFTLQQHTQSVTDLSKCMTRTIYVWHLELAAISAGCTS